MQSSVEERGRWARRDRRISQAAYDKRLLDLAAPTTPSVRMDTGILATHGLKGLLYTRAPNLIPSQAWKGLDTGALGMTEVKLAAPTIGSSWLGPAVLKNLDQGGEGCQYCQKTDRRGPPKGVRSLLSAWAPSHRGTGNC